jgi:hypothetical protein
MALLLDLPDDLVLNYVLLFIGKVEEILILREVSKSFNEKIEMLLLAIIELDLIKLESLKSDELFTSKRPRLEELEDLIKFQSFRLKSLPLIQTPESFDLMIGQGLMCLSRNSINSEPLEEIDYFLNYTMITELKQVLSLECTREVHQKANEMCLNALALPVTINEKQRKLLNWLTGSLKMLEIFFSLEPNYQNLQKLKEIHDFHEKRVRQISHHFGVFQTFN